MGITEIILYNLLCKKMGEQETYELMEFIHSEVKAELDPRTNVFMSKEDKVDLIDRISNVNTLAEKTRSDLIDRINNVAIHVDKAKLELTERINNVKSELIVWLVSLTVLQYILLMITKKFF